MDCVSAGFACTAAAAGGVAHQCEAGADQQAGCRFRHVAAWRDIDSVGGKSQETGVPDAVREQVIAEVFIELEAQDA